MASLSALPVLPVDDIQSAYYLRVEVSDTPGVLARISASLAEAGISIEEMRQQPDSEHRLATLVLLTNIVMESQFKRALARINHLPDLRQPTVWLRVEHLA
jgi:homoserine dehydrogenase